MLLRKLTISIKSKIDYRDIPNLYNCYVIEKTIGHALADCANDENLFLIFFQALTIYKFNIWNNLLTKLRIGPLLYEITETLKSYANGSSMSPLKKFLLYSVENVTVMALMQSLQIRVGLIEKVLYNQAPIIFELIDKESSYYVRVRL